MLGLGLGVDRGGFVPSFLPSDLANLEAWYKADAGITTVSSAVSVWADQSGNGRDVTQGTAANRPAYGSETLNGIDVLTFDISDWLNSAGVSSHNFLHQGDSTFFILARAGNVANPDAVYGYMGSNAGASTKVGAFATYEDRVIFSRNNALNYQVSAGISGTLVAGGIDNDKITANEWRIVGAATDVDLPYADRVDGFVDGVIYDATAPAATPTSTSGLNATHNFQIGAIGNNTLPFLGAMAEIVMYSRKLSVSEIAQVDNYLKAKYAL
jgi:hypothetical protein